MLYPESKLYHVDQCPAPSCSHLRPHSSPVWPLKHPFASWIMHAENGCRQCHGIQPTLAAPDSIVQQLLNAPGGTTTSPRCVTSRCQAAESPSSYASVKGNQSIIKVQQGNIGMHARSLRSVIRLYGQSCKYANRQHVTTGHASHAPSCPCSFFARCIQIDTCLLLMQQAGGSGSTGTTRVLDICPEKVHQRVPLFVGSKGEVDYLETFFDKE